MDKRAFRAVWTLYAARPDSVPVIRCSPPSWAAHAALEQAGLPYHVEWLRFDAGEHRSGRAFELNPAGTLPVLTDGERVWTDTVEILRQITGEAQGPVSPRLQLATVVKTTGMSSFRARMQGDDESHWAPFRSALRDWEQLAGALGDQRPLDATGDEQPLDAAGDEQPLDAAGDEQPLDVTGDEPSGATGDEQPSGVAGDEQPQPLDAAGLLSFTYAMTAHWLGLELDDLPQLKVWLARQSRRRALQATWPSTWPRPG